MLTDAERAALDRLQRQVTALREKYPASAYLWATISIFDVETVCALARRAGAAATPREGAYRMSVDDGRTWHPVSVPDGTRLVYADDGGGATPRDHADGDDDDDYYVGIRPVVDADGHEIAGDGGEG
jgi:hypothetical protein